MGIAVILALPVATSGKAPSWLAQIAGREAPSYQAGVSAVVLLEEERITVKPDGRVLTATRKAVKVLRREGRDQARAMLIYRTDSGKVRRLRAWTIYPSGDVKQYGKKEIVDLALANNDIYNESRVKVVSGAGDADPGAVFGFESLLEDRSIFTQVSHSFQGRLPSLSSRLLLELPPHWTAHGVLYNHDSFEPVVRGSTYTWQLRNLPPIEDEPLRPRLTSLVPRVTVSYFPPENTSTGSKTFKDWQEVSSWLDSLQSPQAVVDEPISNRAKQLVQGKQTDFDRMAAIAEFVQSMNYVSIQIGLGRGGGYRPHPASEVLRKAYGDCKDKTTLMRAMLKVLGIESYPVTIYSGDRDYVRRDWPSPQQFDHVIIAVGVPEDIKAPALLEHERFGRLLLFDPTDPYTPLGQLPEDQQDSLALLLANVGGELIRTPAVPAERNLLVRNVRAKLTEDGELDATIREQCMGSSASEIRALHRRLTRDEYRKMIERWVARGAPGSSIPNIEADDHGLDGFSISVAVSSPRYAKLIGRQLIVFKPAIVARRRGTSFTANERKYPVVLNADAYSETAEIELPPGFVVDEMSGPVKLEADFGSYEADWRTEDGKLYFNRSMKIDNAIIEPSDYNSVKEFFDRMVAAEQAPVVLSRR